MCQRRSLFVRGARAGQGEKSGIFRSWRAAKRLRLFFDGNGKFKESVDLVGLPGQEAGSGVVSPLFPWFLKRGEKGGKWSRGARAFRAGIQPGGGDLKNAEDTPNFFGFAEAVFVGIQRRSGLGHFQKCLGIRTGGILACGSAQVGFGGAIVSQLESSLAGTIKSGKRIGVELDGLAELRERALVVADFGIKIGDAGMENGIFRKIPGKNDELRFGLTGVSPLEIEVDQFEK